MRLVVGTAIVCLASWLALASAAGGIGLQRSISKGAATLFTEQPIAVILVGATAFAVALVVTRVLEVRPLPLFAGIFAGDLVAGVVLAPLAIGELEPIHAPLVVAAVSVLGVQPVAALAGSLVASWRRPAPDRQGLRWQ